MLNNTESHDTMHSHTLAILFAFMGGFIGALSYFFHGLAMSDLATKIDWTELLNYAVRSVVGGLIGILIKAAWDGIKWLIGRIFKKK